MIMKDREFIWDQYTGEVRAMTPEVLESIRKADELYKEHRKRLKEKRKNGSFELVKDSTGKVFASPQPGAKITISNRQKKKQKQASQIKEEGAKPIPENFILSARSVFELNHPEKTKEFYAKISESGGIGFIAVALYRVQKYSMMAKTFPYRGKKGKRFISYAKKNYRIESLVETLIKYPDAGVTFGWGIDNKKSKNKWVLYVDLPNGQVSFHTPIGRLAGPDYAAGWCGVIGASERRIFELCDKLL